MTAQDIIDRALAKIGVKTKGFTLSADDTATALGLLNDVVAYLSTKGFVIVSTTLESVTLVAGQASYSWGTGGDIATARPEEVRRAFIRISNVDYDLERISRDEYFMDINMKSLSARPLRFYYDPTYPTGTLYLDAAPGQAYTMWVDSRKTLTEFADLTTDYSFPIQWRPMFAYQLAVSAAPVFGVGIPQEVGFMADKTLNAIVNNAAASSAQPARLPQGLTSIGRYRRFDINRGY